MTTRPNKKTLSVILKKQDEGIRVFLSCREETPSATLDHHDTQVCENINEAGALAWSWALKHEADLMDIQWDQSA